MANIDNLALSFLLVIYTGLIYGYFIYGKDKKSKLFIFGFIVALIFSSVMSWLSLPTNPVPPTRVSKEDYLNERFLDNMLFFILYFYPTFLAGTYVKGYRMGLYKKSYHTLLMGIIIILAIIITIGGTLDFLKFSKF